MKNNKKESYVKYGVLKQLRMTEQMENLIKSKALEHNTTESEIIRQALSNYINRSMSDSEIVHARWWRTQEKSAIWRTKLSFSH